jgi:hypothetical protein
MGQGRPGAHPGIELQRRLVMGLGLLPAAHRRGQQAEVMREHAGAARPGDVAFGVRQHQLV